ncbi:MAG: DUF1990 family protein [Mycetocola sp.]
MLDAGAPTPPPSLTQPEKTEWGAQDRIYRRFEVDRLIVPVTPLARGGVAGGRAAGTADAADEANTQNTWDRLTDDLLHWRVKTRSGFTVLPGTGTGTGTNADASGVAVRVGARPIIRAGALGIRVHEPVEVVAVVRTPTRVGFAYRTLPGHPVRGEEAFILHRNSTGITLTIRSLTRPAASGMWRALFPLLRVAQVVARFRYLRSLR